MARVAAEHLGLPVMGRPRNRNSQNSQESGNGALLAVIEQLKIQNQELMDLLTSQQSVKGDAKTHTSLMSNAKNSGTAGPSDEEFAWKTKRARKDSVHESTSRMLVQDGWSVPVVQKFEAFRMTETGVYLASRGEAEEAMRELRSEKGLAILTTKQVESGSEEVEFEVKTDQGKSTVWKRYLVQLGAVPVTYKCSAPRGGAVEADTVLAVIDLTKKHCHPDAWTTALTKPKSAAAYWLRKLEVEPVDMFPPRFVGNERIEVVARIQKDSLEKALRGSGEFGIFSRPFFVKGEPRVYKDAPLPETFDLQAAMRKAKLIGSSIHGVVLRGKGFGLRTYESEYEKVIGQVFSEEDARRFTGERWEVINLPLSWSNAVVQAFLTGWSCTVVTSFRAGKTRSAIVRSADPPFHRRLQHDFGCALIRPAEPRKRAPAKVKVWTKPGNNTEESQKAARSWAGVVREGPGCSQTRSPCGSCIGWTSAGCRRRSCGTNYGNMRFWNRRCYGRVRRTWTKGLKRER